LRSRVRTRVLSLVPGAAHVRDGGVPRGASASRGRPAHVIRSGVVEVPTMERDEHVGETSPVSSAQRGVRRERAVVRVPAGQNTKLT
jgi:hypothetical protein